MKSITEFPKFKLDQGIQAKAALTTEGKAPEEIQAGIGEKFKFEGDKLKHFMNAIEVAILNPERLARVLVVGLGEGESAPAKAVKMDESHYIPEFQTDPKAPVMEKTVARGGQSKGKGAKGPKESPWGLSPEQKAAKKAMGSKANKPAQG